jgi:hypothetical protein
MLDEALGGPLHHEWRRQGVPTRRLDAPSRHPILPAALQCFEQQFGQRAGIAAGLVEEAVAEHDQRRLVPVQRIPLDQRTQGVAHADSRIDEQGHRTLTIDASPRGAESMRRSRRQPRADQVRHHGA